jgi:hypothetical protein
VSVSPKVFLWVSLSLHVAVGLAVFGRHAPTHEQASPKAVTEPPAEALFHGNTFEVPVEVPSAVSGDVRDETPAVSEAPSVPQASSRHSSRQREDQGPSRARGGSEGAAAEGSGEGSGAPSVFGATGERSSVDLATAFTRGFPQAASADPVWVTTPYGSAGEAVVVLEIDEAGTLTDSRIEGEPTPALRSGLLRTLALIRARTFTASAKTTRLRVRASVSPDQVHDGLHGEVFAIGGSFAGEQGQAFFALAIGRRVDLNVVE